MAMGRPTLFDKTDGRRVQGLIGRRASQEFEAARLRLSHLVADLTGSMPTAARISDSDVIEFLVLERLPELLSRELKRKREI